MGEAKRKKQAPERRPRDPEEDVEIFGGLLEAIGDAVLAGELTADSKTISLDTVISRPGGKGASDYDWFLDFVNLVERISMMPITPEYVASEIADFDLEHWTRSIPRAVDFLGRCDRAVRARIKREKGGAR